MNKKSKANKNRIPAIISIFLKISWLLPIQISNQTNHENNTYYYPDSKTHKVHFLSISS